MEKDSIIVGGLAVRKGFTGSRYLKCRVIFFVLDPKILVGR